MTMNINYITQILYTKKVYCQTGDLMDSVDWEENIKTNCKFLVTVVKNIKWKSRYELCNGGKHPIYCNRKNCLQLKRCD